METINNCPICGNNEQIWYLTAKDIKISKKKFNIVQCVNCGFVFTNPRPSFVEINLYYGEGYYSYKKPQNKILTNIISNGLKLLDIGCGAGEFLIEKKNCGYEVYGAEIDPKVVSQAKKNNLNIELVTFDKLPYNDNYFDEIHLSHVLEHIHAINEILSEIYRCLKADGKLFIEVPNVDSYDAKNFCKYWRHFDVPRHLYHFNTNSLIDLLKYKKFMILKQSTHDIKSLQYYKGSLSTIKNMPFTRRLHGFINIIRYLVHNVKNNDGLIIKVVACKK